MLQGLDSFTRLHFVSTSRNQTRTLQWNKASSFFLFRRVLSFFYPIEYLFGLLASFLHADCPPVGHELPARPDSPTGWGRV